MNLLLRFLLSQNLHGILAKYIHYISHTVILDTTSKFKMDIIRFIYQYNIYKVIYHVIKFLINFLI